MKKIKYTLILFLFSFVLISCNSEPEEVDLVEKSETAKSNPKSGNENSGASKIESQNSIPIDEKQVKKGLVKPAPVVVAVEPKPVEPAPVVVAVEPKPVEPAPAVVAVEPKPVEPAPAVVAVEPKPVEPAPIAFNTVSYNGVLLDIYPKDLGLMNWANAIEECHKLGSGWRLPSYDELRFMHKLQRKEKSNKSMYDKYWSVTQGASYGAYGVNFKNGSVDHYLKGTYNNVRPIRSHGVTVSSKPPISFASSTRSEGYKSSINEILLKSIKPANESEQYPIIEVNGKKIQIFTRDLGLMNWETATSACKKLGFGWRLPDHSELKMIYKTKYKSNSGDFKRTEYWSSSQVSSFGAYGLDFRFGQINHYPRSKNIQVRAVRELN